MSTDTKYMTDTVEQVAFGAAETVAEVASDPIGSVRRQVKNLEKKGTPTARRINRKVNTRVSAVAEPARDAFQTISKTASKAAGKVAEELVPEKIVMRGLRQMKQTAKRPDVAGFAAKRTLRFFNRSFKTVARYAAKFENASELTPVSKPAAAPRRRVRRTRSRRAA